jgi:hypothetical protein
MGHNWVSRLNLKTEQTMNKISVIGIDLGKNAFHVHGVDEQGNRQIQRQISRAIAEVQFHLEKGTGTGINACVRRWREAVGGRSDHVLGDAVFARIS